MAGFTTLQFLWVAAPLFVSGVTLLALNQLLNAIHHLDHQPLIQALIRHELDKMKEDAKQAKILDDMTEQVLPGYKDRLSG